MLKENLKMNSIECLESDIESLENSYVFDKKTKRKLKYLKIERLYRKFSIGTLTKKQERKLNMFENEIFEKNVEWMDAVNPDCVTYYKYCFKFAIKYECYSLCEYLLSRIVQNISVEKYFLECVVGKEKEEIIKYLLKNVNKDKVYEFFDIFCKNGDITILSKYFEI